MFVVIGILAAAFCFWLDLDAAGSVVLIAGVLVQSLPRKYVMGMGQPSTAGRARARREARRRADYDVRELAGELTAAELKAEQEEERQAHNKHMSSAAFWSGSDSYIDYDGYKRNATTHERMYMNRNDKGNGRR